jgi:hypothetical protein
MRRIDVNPRRLRPGEVIAGVAALALLVLLFALPWFGTRGPVSRTAAILGVVTSFDGWHAFTQLRWLIMLTILVAFALAFFQSTRRAPAIPVCLSVILTVLGTITVLALVYRVLVNVPGPGDLVTAKAGAYLGLAGAAAVTYGGFASMRREGILDGDGPGEIPTVTTRSAAPTV